MIKIKKKKKAESSPAINIEEASSDKNYTIRHLKTDYPVGEDRIKQLALTSKRLVPCEITSEDDYYVFSYETKGLKTLDSVKSARLIDKYDFLINVSFLEELTDIYSFSLNPDNLMIDIGFRAYVLDRTFQTNDSTFLAEYKALAGAVLDGSHSYEDFLKGGNDLFSQTDVLSKVLAADSVNGVVKAVTEAAAIEQKNLDENFVTVKKEDIARHKVLLPVLCTIMIIALALLGYEYFYKGRTNKKILNATEQYFAEDYGSVGKTLTSLNEGKMTDSTRYMAAVSAVRSSGLTAAQKPERFDDFPIYKRSPRIIKTEPYAKIQIKTPDKEERQKRGELVKRILPSCVMIIATILMSVFMRRGMFMMVMVAATGATMIITVVTYFDDKKAKAAEKKERTEAYEEYLLKKRKELYARTEEFKESKRYHNLSLVKIEDEVKHYSNRIYERNFNDEDFLTVSLGTAPGVPSFKIECDDEGYGRAGDKLYSEMLDIYNNFKDVQDIPYVVDLKKSHLGIVGRPEYCRARLRDIVTQTAFFQSYHDVCIVPVVGEANSSEYDWMHWLPHTEIRSINVSGVIIGENQRDQVLGHIARELKARSLTRDESRKETRFTPHYVFLIDESKLIINHSIMEHLKEEGSELGFTLIYITQTEKNLPENVKTILEVEAKNEGKVLMDEGHLINKKLEFDMANIDYETFARRLKPLIHNKGVTTQIPENISFLELYGVKSPAEIDVRNLWNSNATHRSLSVPLGVRGKGDIVTLDLHEKAHGPHGLVAGTTGSGKSEILQSYILSLACNFHPHDVGFLLIDYKGGGMANLFRKLPHLLGTITNLDGAESMRALASIKSELKRRQDVFNRNGVNNINKYSEKFRAGQATEPMPHLFIISDEFAELKKEQPEFMAELVSTARVGRSLGVHLILATQKPTGIVDDQIWSNSRFKLCLKVQNEADSRELLHSGDAANITNPGRAYLQVGNNEIFELFQSAYSGGAYSIEKEQSEADERIFVLNELGQGRLINEDLSLGESNDIAKITQLDAVVDHIKDIYEAEPCTEVKKPWLPPLAAEIINPNITNIEVGELPDTSFDVGIIDMPDKQKQEVYI